ncbi:hypothetical protein DUNSADRAFT_328 [Dunaliella salina]|uniref:Uncharacterized protein n=1 Tax=Dunaliella salina TaxID=3046 RepID=A0ABQ7FZ62_DUNSA|nr:hypothetical protein DUNSADRAFT_328 [Dunaliella salina]|eukprot:KAF5827634.1 hypothetical protein DUNSADRAFT_328 [Dunaliella salina]
MSCPTQVSAHCSSHALPHVVPLHHSRQPPSSAPTLFSRFTGRGCLAPFPLSSQATPQYSRSLSLPLRPRRLQPPSASASGGVNPSEPPAPTVVSSGQAAELPESQEEGEESDSHAGHAILHDFCMMIPYGMLALLASLVMFFAPAPLRTLALPLAGAGGTALGTSVLSLQRWRQGLQSAPLTLATAACSGGFAFYGWQQTRTALTLGLGGPVVPWLAAAITMLSCMLALFCVCNVLAGGNPPRKGSH